jgi:hypothetical protein
MIRFIDPEARYKKGSKLCFFTKKDDALLHSLKHGTLPVFSIDKNITTGSKYFVSGSYDAFWKRYSNFERPVGELILSSEIKLRVLPFAYEVIIEDVPVKLYLDVEGSTAPNPDFDFEAKLNLLLNELNGFLQRMNIVHPAEPWKLVMLDSSTSKKFSRHVIVNISRALFANNYICGALIRRFHVHLLQKFGSVDVNPFYIHPDDDAKSQARVCMLDLSVYTKNRDFRMIGSCKRKGSSTAKQIRWLWMLNKANELTKEIFFESLLQGEAGMTGFERYIINVVDTINGGIPLSSSLKTVCAISKGKGFIFKEPKPIDAQPEIQTGGGSIARLNRIARSVGEWIQQSDHFRDYFRSGESHHFVSSVEEYHDDLVFKINFPTVLHCRARKELTGNSMHKSNSIYFSIHISGDFFGLIQQYCASNTCKPGSGSRIAGIVPIKLAGRFWHEIDLVLGPRNNPDECMFLDDN